MTEYIFTIELNITAKNDTDAMQQSVTPLTILGLAVRDRVIRPHHVGIALHTVDGRPISLPTPMFPPGKQRMRVTTSDEVFNRMHDLVRAAEAVVQNWERGDLAGAVNVLEATAEDVAKLLPKKEKS